MPLTDDEIQTMKNRAKIAEEHLAKKLAKAEAIGFERGVLMAASLLDFSPACAAKRRAILALLEPVTLQKPKA
jgi:hypothetical protein